MWVLFFNTDGMILTLRKTMVTVLLAGRPGQLTAEAVFSRP